MDQTEIEIVRSLLTGRPRPAGWVERRARIEEVCAVQPIAEDVTFDHVDMDGVPGEWSAVPGSDKSRILLFFHGGGYCSGSIISHRRMVTEAGREAGARTLTVGYRLAPEHPFPAALTDALAAWRFLRRQGIPAKQIAVGGDSAGGGLTLALAGQLRSAPEEQPACLWLVSPWTDLTMSGLTMLSKDEADPLINRNYLEELAAAYVPAGTVRQDARISPLFGDFRGLPPTLIQVGSEETLLADATRTAAAAGAAQVAVTMEIWPAMIHAWPIWNAQLMEGRQALANAGAFIKQHFA